MSDEGMPETMDDRLRIADKLINGLVQNNVPLDHIYVDPLVQPISTNSTFAVEFINSVEAIMTRFKGVHTMCGLSNISCLLYTSDAADEEDSVDLGGRRIIKKKKKKNRKNEKK